ERVLLRVCLERLEHLARAARGVADHLGAEVLLALEVVVEGALGHADLVQHLLQTGAVEPLLEEHLRAGLEQALAGGLAAAGAGHLGANLDRSSWNASPGVPAVAGE